MPEEQVTQHCPRCRKCHPVRQGRDLWASLFGLTSAAPQTQRVADFTEDIAIVTYRSRRPGG
jgi:hypothetical protein